MKLHRPLVITAAELGPIQAGYTLAEVGAFVGLALAWWPEGQLPRSTYAAAKLLRTRHSIAKRMLEQFTPCFEPSGAMGLLRAAHIAKARRRGRAGRLALKTRMVKRAAEAKGGGGGGVRNVESTDR